MRRYARLRTIAAMGVVAAMMLVAALPAAAGGATELHFDHQGTECPPGTVGTWHLVANQTRGDRTPSVFTLMTDAGTHSYAADKITGGSQHLTVTDGRVLLNAYTTVGAKLVLSDHTCTEVKEPPKPKPGDYS